MSNHTIRTVIVDDEQPACDVLCKYLNDYCREIEIVAVCRSASKAYEAITNLRPELVFLDIEMPRVDGFGLLKKFGHIDFNIIFVTAFAEYAVKAFRLSAVDYLLKPIKIRELVEAVAKVKENINNKAFQNISVLLENIESPSHQFRKLLVPGLKGTVTINPEDIIMCEADGYCTVFHLNRGRKVTSAYNLKHYEELLSDSSFMRVHNSFIINLDHLEGYNNQGELMLSENNKCPLGTSRKQLFLNTIKKIK